MRRVDVVVGAVWVLLGFATLTQSIPLGLIAERGGPDSGFFPSLVAALFVVLGVLLIAHRLTSPSADFGEFQATSKRKLFRALAVWLALTASIILLPVVGFLAATVLLMSVLLFGIERLRSVRAIATVVLLPVLFWGLFEFLLGVPLPSGPGGI